MASNLGKLFFELGVKNNTGTELDKTQKTFKALDDYINKFNKDLQGSKGILDSFVAAAKGLDAKKAFDAKGTRSLTLYLGALQKIESKMRELNILSDKMKGLKMDVSGVEKMRTALESLKASLNSIGHGNTKTSRLVSFNQILGKALSEINTFQKEFSKGMVDTAAAAKKGVTALDDSLRTVAMTITRNLASVSVAAKKWQYTLGEIFKSDKTVKGGGMVAALQNYQRYIDAVGKSFDSLREKASIKQAGFMPIGDWGAWRSSVYKRALRAEAEAQSKFRDSAMQAMYGGNYRQNWERENSNRTLAQMREYYTKEEKAAAEHVAKMNAIAREQFARSSAAVGISNGYAHRGLGARSWEMENSRQTLAQMRQYYTDQAAAAEARQTQTAQKNQAMIERARAALQEYANTQQRVATAVQQASGAMQQQARWVSDLRNQLGMYFSIYGISDFLKRLIQVGGEYEKHKIALRTILDDGMKADEIYNNLRSLALQSPFSFRQLLGDAKMLAAYSIPKNELYDTTKRLADMSAGLGVDMNRLILAYGQVRAATVLRGQEMRQFTEAGVPIIEKLSQRFSEKEGKTVTQADVFARVSKKQVSFQDVAAVIRQMTDEGGEFYHMQEKLAETLSGKWTIMGDAWDVMMSKIANGGTVTGQVLKSMIVMVTQLIYALDKVSPILLGLAGTTLLKRVIGATAPVFGRFAAASVGWAGFNNKYFRTGLNRKIANTRDVMNANAAQAYGTKQITAKEYRARIAEAKNDAPIIRQLMATKQINKYQLQRLALSGRLNNSLLNEAKTLGIINGEERRRLAQGKKITGFGAGFKSGISSFGSGLWNFIGGWGGAAMIGGTALMSYFANKANERAAISQADKDGKEEAVRIKKEIQDIFDDAPRLTVGVQADETKLMDSLKKMQETINENIPQLQYNVKEGEEDKSFTYKYNKVRGELYNVAEAKAYAENHRGDIQMALTDMKVYDSLKENLNDARESARDWTKEAQKTYNSTSATVKEYQAAKKNIQAMLEYQKKMRAINGRYSDGSYFHVSKPYEVSVYDTRKFKVHADDYIKSDAMAYKEWKFISEQLEKKGYDIASERGQALYWALVNGFNTASENDAGESIINGIALALKTGNEDIFKQELLYDLTKLVSLNEDDINDYLYGSDDKKNSATERIQKNYAEALEEMLELTPMYAGAIAAEFDKIFEDPRYLDVLVKLKSQSDTYGELERELMQYLGEIKASSDLFALIEPKINFAKLYEEMTKLEKETRERVALLNQSALIDIRFRVSANFDASEAKQKLELAQKRLEEIKSKKSLLYKDNYLEDPEYKALSEYITGLKAIVDLDSLGGKVGYKPDGGKKGHDKAAKQAEKEAKKKEREARKAEHDKEAAASKAQREALKKDREAMKDFRENMRDLKEQLDSAKRLYDEVNDTLGNKQDSADVLKTDPKIQERYKDLFGFLPIDILKKDSGEAYTLLERRIDELAKKVSLKTSEAKEEMKDLLDEFKEDLEDTSLDLDIKDETVKKLKDALTQLNYELDKASEYFESISSGVETLGKGVMFPNEENTSIYQPYMARLFGEQSGFKEQTAVEYYRNTLKQLLYDRVRAFDRSNENNKTAFVYGRKDDGSVDYDQLIDYYLAHMNLVENKKIEEIGEKEVETIKHLYKAVQDETKRLLQIFTDAMKETSTLEEEIALVQQKRDEKIAEVKKNSGATGMDLNNRVAQLIANAQKEVDELYTKRVLKDSSLNGALSMLADLPKAYLGDLAFRLGKIMQGEKSAKLTSEELSRMAIAIFDAEKSITGKDEYYKLAKEIEGILSRTEEMFKGADGETYVELSDEQARRLNLPKGGDYKVSILQDFLKHFKSGKKPLDKFFDMVRAIADALQPVVDMFAALGMEDVSDIFGAGNNILNDTMSMKTNAEALFGKDGLFKDLIPNAGAWGAAAGAAVSMVTQIAGLHDKALQKEIEASERRTKLLENESDYIQKVLEKTLGDTLAFKADEVTLKKLATYNQKWQYYDSYNDTIKEGWVSNWVSENTHTQIARALESGNYYEVELASLMAERDEAQLRADKERKKSSKDKNAIDEADQKVRDLNLQIEQFYATMAEEHWDVNIKTWANDLSSALVNAFKNGENAAKAFDETVSDIISGLVSKMIDVQVIQPAMQDLQQTMFGPNGVFTQDSELGADLSKDEAVKLTAALSSLEASTSDAKKIFDYVNDNIGGLLTKTAQGGSGAGIQGITEQTADLLASYVNAIRADVSVIKEIEQRNGELNIIAQAQVRELRSIASNTLRNANAAEEIRDIFKKVTNGTLKVSV